jgi:hypothetical protein
VGPSADGPNRTPTSNCPTIVGWAYIPDMQVFIFRSQIDTSVIAFTTRRGGGNLPAAYAPWELLERVAMLSGAPIAGVSGGSDSVLAGIQRNGFFLSS